MASVFWPENDLHWPFNLIRLLEKAAIINMTTTPDVNVQNRADSGFGCKKANDADLKLQAQSLSANCFFNALLREWQGWTLKRDDLNSNHSPVSIENDGVITFPLNDRNLMIYLRHFSPSGRHQFLLPVILCSEGRAESLSFIQAVKLIVSTDVLWSSTYRSQFISRVNRSVENIQATLTHHQHHISEIFTQTCDFQTTEQSLLTGHSVHPTPKSRDQFSADDAMRYLPEYANPFKLHWFAIEPSLLEADSVHSLSFHQLTKQLAEEDPNFPRDALNIIGNKTLLPAHPWQAQQWLNSDYIRQLLKEQRLLDLGCIGSSWSATSSVRSLYARHASFMLKYSLSVKLTNSIRHLLPKEVVRGKEIHQVKYQSPVGLALQQRYPNFEIITEPAHGAIKGSNGEVLAETMIVLRENPFKNNTDATELLASLTQDNPQGESRLVNLIQTVASKGSISTIARAWFQKYMEVVVEPLVIAQADYGLLFGAHQQNLLITLKEGYPNQAYFRDCQGTGYSHVARELLAVGSSGEHHVDAAMGNRLFTYYLIINSTFGVISALGAGGCASEHELLRDLRNFLHELRQRGPRDTSCLDYILDSQTLWSKHNFYCAYCNINENTLADPLKVYHTMPNPLTPTNA